MQLNRLGRTDIRVSAVGFGTAQLRLVPERQAIDTLLRGFELGVNWVHAAPDYGGAEELVARAFQESGRDDLMLASGCYQTLEKCEELFEHTCRLVGRERLEIYGIACIDDREFVGENVWERGGLVEFLTRKKAEGRIGALYCTTHAPPERIARLIECGVFDAIMLAYNPLGFHVLSYHAGSEGKQYENLEENRRRIFPLARQHGVSLLVMKPFAGGLLCPSKAFPQRHRFSSEKEPLAAGDILRAILRLPGVTSVCPGTASVAEAEENARAGHAPLHLPPPREQRLGEVVDAMRAELCTRCGECEPTCSKHLQISWMVREAYMWSHWGDSFETIDRHHYFVRHPSTALECVTCTDRTCECTYGLDVPALLARAHRQVLAYRADGVMHNTPAERERRTFAGHVQGGIVLCDVPHRLPRGESVRAQLWLENRSNRRWSPERRDAIHELVVLRASVEGIGHVDVPLRHMVEPGERTVFPFSIPPFERAGRYSWRADLVTADGAVTLAATRVHAAELLVYDADQVLPSLGGEVRTHASYGVRYLDWTVPERAAPGSTVTIRLVLENTGTMTWRSTAPLGNRVSVGLFCDGSIAATLELPVAEVPAGGTVTLHHLLAVPTEPGPHTLRFELVEQLVVRFTDRGVAPLEVKLVADQALVDPNLRLRQLAKRVSPWHYHPTGSANAALDGTAFPVFAARATGCRITDVSGREFIDYTMGWGTTVLGYAHPHLKQALARAIESAPVLAYSQAVEIELAAMLVEELPGSEIVAFGKNGSDVCTLAARLSRVHTGRRTILYCGYHGWGDFWAEQSGFAHTGIPDRGERLIHRFRFNDAAHFLELFERHRHDLACVMLEPSGPWGGNDVGHEPDAEQSFLQLLRDKTREAGALLVFDEIVTGFRYLEGSVQRARGIRPDLTCLGKSMASGMPLSALCGPAEFMRSYPRCHYGPTFRGEAYSFHAAMATLEVCRHEPVARFVWSHGQRLREGIDRLMAEAGLRAWMKGPPFRMSIFFDEPDRQRRLGMRTLFQQELLRAGISIFNNGVMLPCFAHDDETLQLTLQAMTRAARLLSQALAEGDLRRHLEIPPLADF
ncbi:MAG TPA: aminotransferase class III-fold pyridoxal phosphate-dependent enzyme [Planctomycetota bacterium]